MRGAVGPVPDDTSLVQAWHDVMSCHARVSGALEKTLQRRHGIGVSEYEVLERLATAGDDQRRMQELAEAVHLSQSALSRLIGRLESDGLVERCMCTFDRRGIYAAITDEGRERFESARPTHRAVLAEHLAEPLGDEADAPAPAPPGA
jgi:DNA-binding MarR family transcriptional regulator